MCSRRMTARVVQLKTHLHPCLSLVPRQITVFSDSWSGLLNPGSNKSPWSNLITVCLCVSVALMGNEDETTNESSHFTVFCYFLQVGASLLQLVFAAGIINIHPVHPSNYYPSQANVFISSVHPHSAHPGGAWIMRKQQQFPF